MICGASCRRPPRCGRCRRTYEAPQSPWPDQRVPWRGTRIRARRKWGRLLTRGRAYLLEVAPGELDLERFQELAERGCNALAAGNPEEAATLLKEALGIWR